MIDDAGPRLILPDLETKGMRPGWRWFEVVGDGGSREWEWEVSWALVPKVAGNTSRKALAIPTTHPSLTQMQVPFALKFVHKFVQHR